MAIHSSSSRVTVFITTILVIAILYFAKDVLIPLALAILLSFVLVPVVQQLQRWRFGRSPATLIVTVFAFAIIGILTWALGHQLINLAEQVPQYKQNLLTKIRSVQSPLGSSLLKTKDTVEELSDELTREVQRILRYKKSKLFRRLLLRFRFYEKHSRIGPVGRTAGYCCHCHCFCNFHAALQGRSSGSRDSPDRIRSIALTTQALDDAAGRVSRFILMQIVINGMMGIWHCHRSIADRRTECDSLGISFCRVKIHPVRDPGWRQSCPSRSVWLSIAGLPY